MVSEHPDTGDDTGRHESVDVNLNVSCRICDDYL